VPYFTNQFAKRVKEFMTLNVLVQQGCLTKLVVPPLQESRNKESKGEKGSTPIQDKAQAASGWNEKFGWRRLFRQTSKASEEEKLLQDREEGKQGP
jgi:hypothetical protein